MDVAPTGRENAVSQHITSAAGNKGGLFTSPDTER